MRKLTLIGIAALLALAPSLTIAQEPPTFLDTLSEALRQEGWNESEVEELVAAAHDLDWDAVEGARPEVVAIALEYARESDPDEGNGLERAMLALELALVSAAMRQAGFDDIDIARAALEGTRDALAEIHTWRESGRDGIPGEIVRDRVLESVRDHIRGDLAGRGRERAQTALRALDELPVVGTTPVGRPDALGPPAF